MSAERPPLPIAICVAAVLCVICGAWIPLEAQPVYGLLDAIMNQPTGALFGHFIIAAVIGGGLLSLTRSRRVLSLPQVVLLVPLAFMMLAIVASFLWTEYRHLTIAGIFEWFAYVMAFILTVGTVGRGQGVRLVLAAITVSISVLAVYGIAEWLASARGGDPSWRIFAHTLNPNVAAGYFGMGAMTGFALFGSIPKAKQPSFVPALGNALIGIAIFCCLIAIFFTGSKGGFLATLGAGLFMAAWRLSINVRTGWPSAAVVVALFGLAYFVSDATIRSYTESGAGKTRLAQAGESQEQSAGFRKLLWQGSVELIKAQPQGYGQGTYRFYSAKPGLTTQTHLSHNSYLQLAVEAGPIALIAFLAFLGMLAFRVFTRTRTQPFETQVMKTGVVAAIATVLLRSVIDSDLHVFGPGILFFILCGLAVQLANDSSAPEFLHPGLRNWVSAAGLLVPLALFYFGVVDLRHGLFLTPKEQPTREGTIAELNGLVGFAPMDSRVAFTAYRYGVALGDPQAEQASKLQRALNLGPTPAMLRAMARLAVETPGQGDPNKYLDRALEYDPNNLAALKLKVELNEGSNPTLAGASARRLIAVEETPYFTIRSLPEIIPTETYWARGFLAQRLSGSERRSMLKPAIEGYRQFAEITVPRVKTFAEQGLDFGGVTVDQAKLALENALKLIDNYGMDEPWLSEAKSSFEDALASLNQ